MVKSQKWTCRSFFTYLLSVGHLKHSVVRSEKQTSFWRIKIQATGNRHELPSGPRARPQHFSACESWRFLVPTYVGYARNQGFRWGTVKFQIDTVINYKCNVFIIDNNKDQNNFNLRWLIVRILTSDTGLWEISQLKEEIQGESLFYFPSEGKGPMRANQYKGKKQRAGLLF